MTKHKAELEKMYKMSGLPAKALIYIKYILRSLHWKLLDYHSKKSPNAVGDGRSSLNPSLIEHWEQEGYLHFKKIFSDSDIDKVNAEIVAFRSANIGGGRIANIHASNRTIFNFLMSPFLQDILSVLLTAKPVLWGSLTFDKGTEQSAHSDSPWFFVNPRGSMVGVWIALENIHPDAGPLFYYPKSHHLPLQVEEVLRKDPVLYSEVKNFRVKKCSASPRAYWDLSKKVADSYSAEWSTIVGDKKIVVAKKGDVLIWHQWLIHGGSPIINQALSRKSIVSHWVSSNAKHFDQHNFFLNYDRHDEMYSQELPIKKSLHGLYLRQYESKILDWA